MILVCFQGKPLSITVIQAYAPTAKAKKAEVDHFHEALQHLQLTPKKMPFSSQGVGMQKGGSQEIPRVASKFGLGVQNEAGQRLTEFCQENTLVIANTLFQKHKRHPTNCGKFLETGVPDHLACPLRNLYVGQEAILRTLCKTMDWFKIGKGV